MHGPLALPLMGPACHQLLANSSNCDCMFFFLLFFIFDDTHTHTHTRTHTNAGTLVLTFGWRQLIFVTFSFIFISCCCLCACYCCCCCCSFCSSCCCSVFVDILFFSNLVRLLSGTEADVVCCYLDNCWNIFASPLRPACSALPPPPHYLTRCTACPLPCCPAASRLSQTRASLCCQLGVSVALAVIVAFHNFRYSSCCSCSTVAVVVAALHARFFWLPSRLVWLDSISPYLMFSLFFFTVLFFVRLVLFPFFSNIRDAFLLLFFCSF